MLTRFVRRFITGLHPAFRIETGRNAACFHLCLTEFQVTPHPTRDPRQAVQLMLPNPHNPPSGSAKLSINQAASFPVVGNFGVPKFPIALRALIALRASVPKTAVHKHNNPFAPEGEIRLAKQRLVAPPAGDSVLPEYFNQMQLGGFVSARADQ